MNLCERAHLKPVEQWTQALSKGSFGNSDLGEETFNRLFWQSPNQIIKRLCPSCHHDYQKIFYRRYTSTNSFKPYSYMRHGWNETYNRLHTDFDIFSTYEDALTATEPWQFCNFDEQGIGFPRDCGKAGPHQNQWNSWIRESCEDEEEPTGTREDQRCYRDYQAGKTAAWFCTTEYPECRGFVHGSSWGQCWKTCSIEGGVDDVAFYIEGSEVPCA